jgi:hypothetical protein
METHIVKFIDTAIQFSQFFTALSFILLSATGAAFYYFWTSKKFNFKLTQLSLFLIPTGSVGYTFYYLAKIYSLLMNQLAEGNVDKYVETWLKKAGNHLWIPFFFAVVSLILVVAFLQHKTKKSPDS